MSRAFLRIGRQKNKLKSVKSILSDAYQNDRMTLNSALILIRQVARVDS